MDEFNNQNTTGGSQIPPTNNQVNPYMNADGEYRYVPPKQQQPVQQYYQPQPNKQYYAPVNSNPTSGSYTNPYQQPVPPFNAPEQQKKKKSKSLIVVAVIGVLVAIMAFVGIGVAINGGGNISSDKKEEVTQSESKGESNNKGSATVNSGSTVAKKDSDGNLTVAGVVENTMDSCVLISVYSQQSAYDYFYSFGNDQSSNPSEPTLSGEGSGVIMSEAGGKTYVMTCAHVISGASQCKVTTNDGKEYDATIVGIDAQTDIGVLAIEAKGLKIAEFADSKDIVVGEQVIVIGCPGGSKFMNSVATGIVSALDRPVSSSIGYDNECIQTDAAINPGNSGGALFNMNGQVIGINSSKIASTDYEGMGFAVPSNTAVNTANSLIQNGYVAGRAKLGITYLEITKARNANAILNALEEKGFKDAQGAMIIDEVDSGSDLSNKDIKQYDMIVAINGKTMTSTDVLTNTLSKSSPGDTVTLTIARIENNKIKTFEVKCKLIESKG